MRIRERSDGKGEAGAMEIQMIGIDHENASIEQREAFAFTKNQAKRAMKRWKETGAFKGCLLLSTCNRTELWASTEEETDLFPFLCEEKGKDPEEFGKLLVRRDGSEAITHLLQLICGLRSRIYGENQIISQIRAALELSRECGCDDMVIEKLFQTAVAAGKRVRTSVKMETADPSAAGNALMLLREKTGSLKGTPCLIIGNGQMGKLVANMLTEAGADVTMTLRRRIHGKEVHGSIVPEGCRMIDYDDRLKGIEDYTAVISATLSPHFTVTADDLKGMRFSSAVWIDMAVPRDIEEGVGDIKGISLYNMDSIGDAHIVKRNEKSLRESMEILEEYRENLEKWFAFRKHIDLVKTISRVTTDDARKRMEKTVNEAVGREERRADIYRPIETAVDKAVAKLLFGLRDTLPKSQWESCLSALEESARRDTLKTGKAKNRKYHG